MHAHYCLSYIFFYIYLGSSHRVTVYNLYHYEHVLDSGAPPFPAPFGNPRFMGNMPMRPPMPMMPPANAMPKAPDDYSQTAAFNSRSGRFQFSGFGAIHNAGSGENNIAVKQHWASKGLAPDAQGRQMGHYFNFDSWQEAQQPGNKNKRRRK